VANLLSVTLTDKAVTRVVPQLGGVEKQRLTVNVVIAEIIEVSSRTLTFGYISR
jgi:hypothetical protein